MIELKIIMRPLAGWGVTYGPPGDGPFPAVMILHGSEGGWAGWNHVVATTLAAHGFLAMPFCYGANGSPWNAGDIADVPLDRTAEALAALRRSPLGNGRAGLYGGSRGGEHALLLTALMVRDGVEGVPDAVAAHSATASTAATMTGPRSLRAGPGLAGAIRVWPRVSPTSWWLSARAKSAHRSNRSAGSLASALANTGSRCASSGRRSPMVGGAEDRCWLMTTAGLVFWNGGLPVSSS